MSTWRILEGDCLMWLRELDAGSVHTCVTSPPYFGLRDYGTGEWEDGEDGCDHVRPCRVDATKAVATSTLVGSKDTQGHLQEPSYRDVCGKCGARRIDRQIGLEATPDEFVAGLVARFREVRRVLRDDGTLWLNIGDSYAGPKGWRSEHQTTSTLGPKRDGLTPDNAAFITKPRGAAIPAGVKAKDLLGIPWMVAFALRADGWYLRSDIIWHKPNPMPESVTDRPTSAHEHVFLLAKSARYFYDADAISEAATDVGRENGRNGRIEHEAARPPGAGSRTLARLDYSVLGRNKRNVWQIATQPYAGSHFATFPPKLIEPCILAGCPEGGTVLDPFAGAGTTGLVALRHNRSFAGIELNPVYAALARDRIVSDAPLLNAHAEVA